MQLYDTPDFHAATEKIEQASQRICSPRTPHGSMRRLSAAFQVHVQKPNTHTHIYPKSSTQRRHLTGQQKAAPLCLRHEPACNGNASPWRRPSSIRRSAIFRGALLMLRGPTPSSSAPNVRAQRGARKPREMSQHSPYRRDGAAFRVNTTMMLDSCLPLPAPSLQARLCLVAS
jgi:hypothetical protein